MTESPVDLEAARKLVPWPPQRKPARRGALPSPGSVPAMLAGAARRLDIARIYIPLLFVLSCVMLCSVFVGQYVALLHMNSLLEIRNVGVLGPKADLGATSDYSAHQANLQGINRILGSVMPTTHRPSTAAIRDWASNAERGPPPKGLPGVSIVAACRNRHETFSKSFGTFLAADKVDEVVLVDWSSSPPLSSIVEEYEDDRVRYVHVDGEENWVLSRAYNLGVSQARYETILRLDCDHAISTDFVDAHPLDTGDPIFYSGDWKQAKNENEVHLNGAMVLYRSQFWEVFGYDERIQTYGWDDEDMFSRLEKAGYKRVPLNYSHIIHLLHPESARAQKGVEFAAVETDVNRILLEKLELWSPRTGENESSVYALNYDEGHQVASVAKIPKRVTEYFTQEEVLKAWDEALGRRLHDDFGVMWDLILRLERDQKRNLLRQLLVKKKDLGGQDPKMMILHASHGLGNRIRAFGSAMAFTKATNRVLVLIWETDDHCSAEFGDLFKNDFVVSKEPLKWPFTNNHQWDAAWKGVVGFNYMTADGEGAVKDAEIENFPTKHMYYKGAYIMNAPGLSSWEEDNLQIAALEPLDDIQRMVDDHVNNGLAERIGLHIRNMGLQEEVASIDPLKEYGGEAAELMNFWRRKSGVNNFVTQMEEIIKADPSATFFVASDTHQVVRALRDKFPGKVESHERDCDGRESGCLKHALVDMLCLARTKQLYGSNWSSFTEAVERIGHKKALLAGVDFAKE